MTRINTSATLVMHASETPIPQNHWVLVNGKWGRQKPNSQLLAQMESIPKLAGDRMTISGDGVQKQETGYRGLNSKAFHPKAPQSTKIKELTERFEGITRPHELGQVVTTKGLQRTVKRPLPKTPLEIAKDKCDMLKSKINISEKELLAICKNIELNQRRWNQVMTEDNLRHIEFEKKYSDLACDIELNADGNPYVLIQEMGRGTTTIVWKAIDYNQNKLVAYGKGTVESIEGFIRERSLFNELKDVKEIVQLDRFFTYEGDGQVKVMELCEKGDLERILADPDAHLTDQDKAKITMGILNGVLEFHKRNIIHGDIKPGNILLTGDSVKIGDIGYSHHEAEPFVGATFVNLEPRAWGYFFPQIENLEEESDKMLDVFATALTFYKLWFSSCPKWHDALYAFAAEDEVDNKNNDQIVRFRDETEEAIKEAFKDRDNKENPLERLLLDMTNLDIQKRPTIEQVREEMRNILKDKGLLA